MMSRRRVRHIFILLSMLLCLPAPALNRADRAKVDSLWKVGMEYSRHGRFEESNAVFEGILANYRIPKRGRMAAYGWLGNNAQLSGDYKAYYRFLTLQYGQKENDIDQATFKALSLLPEESLSRPDSTVTVRYRIDSLYYEGEFKGCEIRLPATIGGKDEMMILDNGCAKFSAASESFAHEHGIRPVGAEGSAIGVVDKVSMWIGVADSLSVGAMVFRNILFTVIPDRYLENPVTKIDVMLGANIFRLAGDMVFDNLAGTVSFPYAQMEQESNLTINPDGEHLADVVVKGDTLTFQLDLGAARTGLNAYYFDKFREEIIETAIVDTLQFGGVGGITDELPVYNIPDLSLESCGGVFTMESTTVSLDRQSNEAGRFGVVGNDFLLSFPRVVLNLKKMYLLPESPSGEVLEQADSADDAHEEKDGEIEP